MEVAIATIAVKEVTVSPDWQVLTQVSTRVKRRNVALRRVFDLN